jgi:hypothetical protein
LRNFEPVPAIQTESRRVWVNAVASWTVHLGSPEEWFFAGAIGFRQAIVDICTTWQTHATDSNRLHEIVLKELREDAAQDYSVLLRLTQRTCSDQKEPFRRFAHCRNRPAACSVLGDGFLDLRIDLTPSNILV